MRIKDIADGVLQITVGGLLGLAGTAIFLIGCAALAIALVKLLPS